MDTPIPLRLRVAPPRPLPDPPPPWSGERPVLGVLGGMGPLASAEFLRTVYRHARWTREQEAPPVILASFPAFPDRTEAFLAGREDAVLEPLCGALRALVAAGAGPLAVCCVTAHHLFDRLPDDLRPRMVSLVDLAVDALRGADGVHLMLCTRGTAELRVFQRHPGWAEVADRVRFPGPAGVNAVHRLAYRVKRGVPPARLAPAVAALLRHHGVRGFVAGCTEIHLLARRFLRSPGGSAFRCVDPLDALARAAARGALPGRAEPAGPSPPRASPPAGWPAGALLPDLEVER